MFYCVFLRVALTVYCACQQKWGTHGRTVARYLAQGPFRTARTPTAKSCLGKYKSINKFIQKVDAINFEYISHITISATVPSRHEVECSNALRISMALGPLNLTILKGCQPPFLPRLRLSRGSFSTCVLIRFGLGFQITFC